MADIAKIVDYLSSNAKVALAAADIEGSTQTSFATSAAAAQSAALDAGVYGVWATQDTHIRVADTATGVTAANGYLIKGTSAPVPIVVRQGKKIGAIAGGAGTLYYHRIL